MVFLGINIGPNKDTLNKEEDFLFMPKKNISSRWLRNNKYIFS